MALLTRPRSWGTTKPPPGVQINWGHPLAQGLVFCVLASKDHRWELVSGQFVAADLTKGAWTPTQIGDGFTPALSAGGDTGMVSVAPRGLLTSTLGHAFTLAVWAQPAAFIGPGSGSDATLLSQPYNAGINSPYTMLNLGRDGTSSSLNLAYVNSTTRYLIASDTGAIQTTDPFMLYAGTRQGATATFYRNGVQHGTAKTFGADLACTLSTEPISLMAYSSTVAANGVNGRCGGALIWNRALSGTELRWLRAEPYAFLAPPPPKIFFFPSSGATVSGTGAIAGAGAISGTGLSIVSGSGAVAGVGAISGSGTTVHSGTAAITGSGAIAGAGTVVRAGTGAIAGAGTVTGTGRRTTAGVGAVAGSGAITGQGAQPAGDPPWTAVITSRDVGSARITDTTPWTVRITVE